MIRNSSKNLSLLICLTLTIVTLAVFWQVHKFDFVSLDDPLYVTCNSNIQTGFTLKAIKWSITTGYGNFWHPITWLSYILDWQLYGLNAGGYHLTNLVIHILNILLLFIIFKRMTGAIWQSAFVSALFALHPLHVESVAWISSRKDVLSTFFWMLTIYAYTHYVKKPGAGKYLIMITTFSLGLMTKPMLVTLPFVLLLLDYWPLERIEHFEKSVMRRLFVEKIPFFVLSAFFSLITFIAQKGGGALYTVSDLSLKLRIINALISYLKYIEKMFWPEGLAFFYPYNISILYAAISAALLAGVTIFVFLLGKQHKYLVTGWFWYVGTLVPVIGLIQIGSHSIADRYSYVTLTGLFIILAWGSTDLLKKIRYGTIALTGFSLIALSALGVFGYRQVGFWEDGLTICKHTLKVTKNNYKIYFLTAETLLFLGDTEGAFFHYIKALQIYPDYTDALNGLGYIYFKTGQNSKAVECYQKAIQVNPKASDSHANLATAFANDGRFEEAIEQYKIAMQDINTPEIHIGLGVTLQHTERFEEAKIEYEKALAAEPGNVDVHNNLGIVLSSLCRFDEAIQHFSRAIQLDANCTAARNNLNNALINKQMKLKEEK